MAGRYTMANCSGQQVKTIFPNKNLKTEIYFIIWLRRLHLFQTMVKEDYWGLTRISYTEGRWQITRQAKRGESKVRDSFLLIKWKPWVFKVVEESYLSSPTNATCPEMSPGLEGGYIALGNKVVCL